MQHPGCLAFVYAGRDRCCVRLCGGRTMAPSAERRIVWSDATPGWVIRDHAVARAAVLDPHLDVVRDVNGSRDGVTPTAGQPSPVEFLQSWFSRADRDRHRELRRHLHRPYSEQSIAALETSFREIARESADRLDDDG